MPRVRAHIRTAPRVGCRGRRSPRSRSVCLGRAPAPSAVRSANRRAARRSRRAQRPARVSVGPAPARAGRPRPARAAVPAKRAARPRPEAPRARTRGRVSALRLRRGTRISGRPDLPGAKRTTQPVRACSSLRTATCGAKTAGCWTEMSAIGEHDRGEARHRRKRPPPARHAADGDRDRPARCGPECATRAQAAARLRARLAAKPASWCDQRSTSSRQSALCAIRRSKRRRAGPRNVPSAYSAASACLVAASSYLKAAPGTPAVA